MVEAETHKEIVRRPLLDVSPFGVLAVDELTCAELTLMSSLLKCPLLMSSPSVFSSLDAPLSTCASLPDFNLCTHLPTAFLGGRRTSRCMELALDRESRGSALSALDVWDVGGHTCELGRLGRVSSRHHFYCPVYVAATTFKCERCVSRSDDNGG